MPLKPIKSIPPSDAFRSVFRRIGRLEEIIHSPNSDARQIDGCIIERNALLWFVEKVIEQAKELARRGQDTETTRAIIARRDLGDYLDKIQRIDV